MSVKRGSTVFKYMYLHYMQTSACTTYVPSQVEEFDENEGRFRQSVVDAVNGQLARTDAGRKRQQTDLTAGDVFIVAPSPRVLDDGTFEVVFFVQSDSGAVINADVLANAVNETGATLAAEVCIQFRSLPTFEDYVIGYNMHPLCNIHILYSTKFSRDNFFADWLFK